jgi:hypothetical protein
MIATGGLPRGLALAAVVAAGVVGAAGAALAAGPVGDDGHLDPAAFELVVPGVSRAEVDERLGEPYLSSSAVVVAGEIDLFVDEITFGPRSGGRPRPTEDVHFYDYRPDAHPSEFARIVFRKDRVWYALLPPRAGEATLESARALHGRDFETTTVQHGSRHVRWTTRIHRIPALGVGVVEWSQRGVTHRLVFPPER